MTQMSMDEILAGEGTPAAETAEEMLSPDERAVLDEQREAAAPTEQDQQSADTSAAEQPQGDEQSQAPEPKAEPDDQSDLPDSIRRTLEARPEDAENWRNLRGIAKDAQQATKDAHQRAQEAAAEAARLRAELEAARTQVAQPPAPVQPQTPVLPDPTLDPAGYAQALVAQEVAQVRAEMRSSQLDQFEAAAVRTHGKQAVDEAFAWLSEQAKTDPALVAQQQAAVDPWDFIVREKARRETLAQMGDDPMAYIEEQKRAAVAAALAEQQSAAGQATSEEVERQIAQRLPRSLAKTPGAGGQATSNGYAGPTPMSQIVPGITPSG